MIPDGSCPCRSPSFRLWVGPVAMVSLPLSDYTVKQKWRYFTDVIKKKIISGGPGSVRWVLQKSVRDRRGSTLLLLLKKQAGVCGVGHVAGNGRASRTQWPQVHSSKEQNSASELEEDPEPQMACSPSQRLDCSFVKPWAEDRPNPCLNSGTTETVRYEICVVLSHLVCAPSKILTGQEKWP